MATNNNQTQKQYRIVLSNNESSGSEESNINFKRLELKPANISSQRIYLYEVILKSIFITASNNDICTGTTINFVAYQSGFVNPTYTWYVNTTQVGTNSRYYSNSNLSNNDEVTCVCDETPTGGEPKTSNTIIITVRQKTTPTIVISGSTYICSGNTVSLYANYTYGGQNPIFQWYLNNSIINGAVFSSYKYKPNDNDVVKCYLGSNESCITTSGVTSSELTINVIEKLPVSVTISAIPSGTTCSGVTVTYNAIGVNSGTTTSFRWYVNNIYTGDSTNQYSYIPNNNDTIYCIMSSNVQCSIGNPATSNTIIQYVTENLTPSITIYKVESTVCSGSTVHLYSAASNTGSHPTFQWYKNVGGIGTFSPIIGQTGTTYSYIPVNNNDNIKCIMTSSYQCLTQPTATSNIIIIPITQYFNQSLTIYASPTGVTCSGTTITYTASGVTTGTTTYSWYINDQYITIGNTYSYKPLNGDIIQCIMNSNWICVRPNPVYSNIINQQVFDYVTPYAVINSIPDHNTSNEINLYQSSNHQVYLYLTDLEGVCDNPKYVWKVNDSIVGTNSSTYTYYANDKDEIKCIISSDCNCPTITGYTTETLTVKFIPDVDYWVNISGVTTLCSGETSSLFAYSSGYTTPIYNWFISGVTNSIYTGYHLQYSNFVHGDRVYCECDNIIPVAKRTSNSLEIHINSIVFTVDIGVEPSDTVCSLTPITFTAYPMRNNMLIDPFKCNYEWWYIDNGGTHHKDVVDFEYQHSTIYEVDGFVQYVKAFLIPQWDCLLNSGATSTGITMHVTQNLEPSVTISSNRENNTICWCDTGITFTAEGINSGNTPIFTWYVGTWEAYTGIGYGQILTPEICFQNGDIIRCSMWSSLPCVIPNPSYSEPIILNVIENKNLTVFIVSEPDSYGGTCTICAGTNVRFYAYYNTGLNDVTFDWYLNGSIVGHNNSYDGGNSLQDGDIIYCEIFCNDPCVFPSSANTDTITMDVLPNYISDVFIYSDCGHVSGGDSYVNVCPYTGISFFVDTDPMHIINSGNTPYFIWYLDGLSVHEGYSDNGGLSYYYYNNGEEQKTSILYCTMIPDLSCCSSSNSNNYTIYAHQYQPQYSLIEFHGTPPTEIYPESINNIPVWGYNEWYDKFEFVQYNSVIYMCKEDNLVPAHYPDQYPEYWQNNTYYFDICGSSYTLTAAYYTSPEGFSDIVHLIWQIKYSGDTSYTNFEVGTFGEGSAVADYDNKPNNTMFRLYWYVNQSEFCTGSTHCILTHSGYTSEYLIHVTPSVTPRIEIIGPNGEESPILICNNTGVHLETLRWNTGPNPTYQWMSTRTGNWLNEPDATENNFTTGLLSQPTQYKIRMTSNNPCQTTGVTYSDVFYVSTNTIFYLVPHIEDEGNTMTICLNDNWWRHNIWSTFNGVEITTGEQIWYQIQRKKINGNWEIVENRQGYRIQYEAYNIEDGEQWCVHSYTARPCFVNNGISGIVTFDVQNLGNPSLTVEIYNSDGERLYGNIYVESDDTLIFILINGSSYEFPYEILVNGWTLTISTIFPNSTRTHYITGGFYGWGEQSHVTINFDTSAYCFSQPSYNFTYQINLIDSYSLSMNGPELSCLCGYGLYTAEFKINEQVYQGTDVTFNWKFEFFDIFAGIYTVISNPYYSSEYYVHYNDFDNHVCNTSIPTTVHVTTFVNYQGNVIWSSNSISTILIPDTTINLTLCANPKIGKLHNESGITFSFSESWIPGGYTPKYHFKVVRQNTNILVYEYSGTTASTTVLPSSFDVDDPNDKCWKDDIVTDYFYLSLLDLPAISGGYCIKLIPKFEQYWRNRILIVSFKFEVVDAAVGTECYNMTCDIEFANKDITLSNGGCSMIVGTSQSSYTKVTSFLEIDGCSAGFYYTNESNVTKNGGLVTLIDSDTYGTCNKTRQMHYKYALYHIDDHNHQLIYMGGTPTSSTKTWNGHYTQYINLYYLLAGNGTVLTNPCLYDL